MQTQLAAIEQNAQEMLAAAATKQALEEVRVHLLGKKGALTAVLKQMGTLPAQERPAAGAMANTVREGIEGEIRRRTAELDEAELAIRLASENIDITLPGIAREVGKKHPLQLVLDEIKEIFLGMGFDVVQGPEVEYDKYNFEMLNMPRSHPARDVQDTFYITEDILLRTQTSPMEIRTMLSQEPPIRVVIPGRVYRSDTVDATHSPLFHQIEGLVVAQDITFSDLKGTLEAFAQKLFGTSSRARFRPHHFPYTEPSAEMDMQCFKCGGKGCPLCKGEGWIEVLGCGFTHPKVLENCGLDPNVYTGFAFGMGLERLVMMRYNIDDLRLLYENDLRFLRQF
ncbi:phenylalanine--tRNA ligase subunit alpha [Ruminococcaceae bacterium OttesenSCG-928-N02]|nr:phenylalanine--tRNA ligase subunit alpha [Ruminococcaceae bacterium OttesenSCG-928-N02]